MSEKVTILSQKDLEISYFCGSGAGGQARNKVASGVQMRHLESGAIGRASDSRSQYDNKKSAFKRLLGDKRMKFWLAKKVYEVQREETIEETVRRDMEADKLRFEVMENGRWIEVNEAHFDTEKARAESVA